MKIRLILWGIGKIYNSMINLLNFYIEANQIEIVGVTAQNLPNFQYLDNYPLLSMKEVKTIAYDYVMVMSDDYFDEIVDFAMITANVPRDKIVSFHVMEIPSFLSFFSF